MLAVPSVYVRSLPAQLVAPATGRDLAEDARVIEQLIKTWLKTALPRQGDLRLSWSTQPVNPGGEPEDPAALREMLVIQLRDPREPASARPLFLANVLLPK